MNNYAFSLQLEIHNCCFLQSNDYECCMSTVNEQQCSSIHMRCCNILYFTKVNLMCVGELFYLWNQLKIYNTKSNEKNFFLQEFSPNEQFSR
jgi:hypothetical protein